MPSTDRRTRFSSAWPSIALLVLVGGCDPPSAPFRWQSDHFVYSSQSVPVLSEDEQIAEFERHFATLTDAMGVELAPGDRIDYRQFDDQLVIIDFNGGDPAIGVYAPEYDVVLTINEFNGHELVHAYAARSASEVPMFLTEGLAHALSCGAGYRERVPDRAVASWITREDMYSWDGSEVLRRYAVSQSFVAFVIARHGLRALMSAYRDLGGRQDVDAVFRDRLGEGLEPMLDAWMAEGPALARCVGIPECTAGDVEAPDAPLELDFATRHYFPGWQPSPEGGEEIRVLALPEGRQRWTTRSESPLQVVFLPCEAAPLPPPFLVLPGEQRTWLDLPGGTMAVLFGSDARLPATVTIESVPETAPLVARACGDEAKVVDATDLEVGMDRTEVLQVIDADLDACVDGCEMWVEVRTTGTVEIVESTAFGIGGGGANVTRMCDATCGACADIGPPAGLDRTLLASGTYWLRLRVGLTDAIPQRFVDVMLGLHRWG